MVPLFRTGVRWFVLSTTLTCAYGAGLADLPDSELALYERLLEEYPKALEKLVLKNFECTGTLEEYRLTEDDETSRERYAVTCRILEGFALCERRLEMATGSSARRRRFESEVICEAPRYMFRLQRSAENSPWTVRAHSASKRDMELAMVLVGTVCKDYVNATHCLLEIPFEELIDGSTCEILSVRPDDAGTVKVEFDLDKEHWWYDSGSVTLVPELGWTVQEYTLVKNFSEIAATRTVRGRVETKNWKTEAGETVIFPKTVSYTIDTTGTDESGKPLDVIDSANIEFHTISPGTVTPEDFTLAAYGLPEMPLQSVPRSRRTMLWWFIALNVSAAAFFLSVWYRRKKKRGFDG